MGLTLLLLDYAQTDFSLLARSFAKPGFAVPVLMDCDTGSASSSRAHTWAGLMLLAFGATRPEILTAVPDSVKLELSPPAQGIAASELMISLSGQLRLGPSTLILDVAQVAPSPLLRSRAWLGATPLACGFARVGSCLPLVDTSSLDSMLLPKSFGRLGLMLSVLTAARSGSAPLVSDLDQPGSTLLMRSLG